MKKVELGGVTWLRTRNGLISLDDIHTVTEDTNINGLHIHVGGHTVKIKETTLEEFIRCLQEN